MYSKGMKCSPLVTWTPPLLTNTHPTLAFLDTRICIIAPFKLYRVGKYPSTIPFNAKLRKLVVVRLEILRVLMLTIELLMPQIVDAVMLRYLLFTSVAELLIQMK